MSVEISIPASAGSNLVPDARTGENAMTGSHFLVGSDGPTETEETLKSAIEQHLECPICCVIPKDSKNLGMCTSGHLVCQPCIANLKRLNAMARCPTCRDAPFADRAPVVLQKILEDFLKNFPQACMNSIHGCQHVHWANLMSEHEQKCMYRKFPCPQINCKSWHTLAHYANPRDQSCVEMLVNWTARGYDMAIPMTDFYDEKSHFKSAVLKAYMVPDFGTDFIACIKILSIESGLIVMPVFLTNRPANNAIVEAQFNLGLSAYCQAMGTLSKLVPANFMDTTLEDSRCLVVPKSIVRNWCFVMGCTPVTPDNLMKKLEDTDLIDPSAGIHTLCSLKRKHFHLLVKYPIGEIERTVVANHGQVKRMA